MTNCAENFQKLNKILAEVQDLRSAAAVLHWDQSTYMPEKVSRDG